MALKDLTTPTLITLFDAWLDPNQQRVAIEALKRSAPLLPDIEAARADLKATHAADGATSPELTKVRQKCATLDGTHDRKARGLDKIMEGLAELIDDGDLAEKIETARTEVLGPMGLTVVTTSHGDEAQNAKLADTRLSPASKALLQGLTVGDKSLAGWVQNWQGVAAELGKADAERTAIETKAKTVTPADAVKARNKAIRATNGFLAMLDLDAPDAKTRKDILDPLEVALSKAARRGRKAAGTGMDDAAGNGQPAAKDETANAPG